MSLMLQMTYLWKSFPEIVFVCLPQVHKSSSNMKFETWKKVTWTSLVDLKGISFCAKQKMNCFFLQFYIFCHFSTLCLFVERLMKLNKLQSKKIEYPILYKRRGDCQWWIFKLNGYIIKFCQIVAINSMNKYFHKFYKTRKF